MYKVSQVNIGGVLIKLSAVNFECVYFYDLDSKRIRYTDNAINQHREYALGAEIFAKKFLEHNKDFLK